MREKGIYVPVIFVLTEQRKSQVKVPNKRLVLVDNDPNICDD